MTIIYALLSYMFGAIPTGYIIFRLTEKDDIRRYGSQATGATNVLRLKGWKYGVPVGIADVSKGFLPVALAMKIFSDERIALLCGFLAVLGHCYPVFIRFRGGKGVASAAGVFLAIAPLFVLMCAGIFLASVLITRFVSLGSLLAMGSFPLIVLLFEGNGNVAFMGMCVFILILLRHKGNIQRLIAGNERKIGEKKI
ncbi:MAG: glycerol-3-phosphate 1-O-acyltransferase PlsY [Candidatus Aminicenantes bacterium]|nr:glycerol-3-phosphate 1-O-acyltransferase PlsY [Candidatus Aminicenantes bacterium]